MVEWKNEKKKKVGGIGQNRGTLLPYYQNISLLVWRKKIGLQVLKESFTPNEITNFSCVCTWNLWLLKETLEPQVLELMQCCAADASRAIWNLLEVQIPAAFVAWWQRRRSPRRWSRHSRVLIFLREDSAPPVRKQIRESIGSFEECCKKKKTFLLGSHD